MGSQPPFSIDKSNDSILAVDIKFTKVLHANPKVCQLLEYSLDELISLHLDTIFPEQKSSLKDFLHKAIEHGLAATGHLACRTHTGKFMSTVVSGSVAMISGNPQLLVMIYNVDSKRLCDEAFKTKEDIHSRANQLSRFGYWEKDIDTGEEYWCERVYTILGIDPSEALPCVETLLKAVHLEDHHKVLKANEEAQASGKPVNFGYRIRRPDGELRYIHSVVELSTKASHGPAKLVGIVIDVSDSVNYEKDQYERDAGFRLVSDIARGRLAEVSVFESIKSTMDYVREKFPVYRISYGVLDNDSQYKVLISLQPEKMSSLEGTKIDLSIAPLYVTSLLAGIVKVDDVINNRLLDPVVDVFKVAAIRSFIKVPLRHSKELRGILGMDSPEPRSWTGNEMASLLSIGKYLEIAINDANLMEEVKKQGTLLKQTEKSLIKQKSKLEEKNITLKHVLGHLEREKADFKEEICEKVQDVLAPIVSKLRNNRGLDDRDLSILTDFLNSVVGKNLDVFRNNLSKLTPREFEICDLIALNMSSKQISETLNLSLFTVHKHRESIREKLQITNKEINLSAYLKTAFLHIQDT